MTLLTEFLSFHPQHTTTTTTSTTTTQIRYDDDEDDEGPQPDTTLEQGVPIPVRMQGKFPPELASTPLEDIDSFYANRLVGGSSD